MGERDAFGREIGEDTLADMGWQQPGRTEPAPDWVATTPAPPAAKPAPAPAPVYRPPVRRRRGFSRLLLALVLLVVAAASAGSVIRLGSEAVDRGQRALRDAIPTPLTTEDGTPAGESLLRPAALRRALAKLPDGRVTVLTLRPDALDATVSTNGNTTVVHMTADGDITTVDAPVGIPGDGVKVNPAAPARIVRTVTRRTGRDADSISNLVLTNVGGRAQWTLLFSDGLRFTANATGQKVRRAG